MSYAIAEVRAQNPMWYFERNYTLLMELLTAHGLDERDSAEYPLGRQRVRVVILERTRYTVLLGIELLFGERTSYLSDLVFKVRAYLDAALAEVIAYQGYHQFKARYPYPNEDMLHPDEKRQANLLLHEWLSSWERSRQLSATSSA